MRAPLWYATAGNNQSYELGYRSSEVDDLGNTYVLSNIAGPGAEVTQVRAVSAFDPNGARMELTTVTAGAEQMADYRAKARAELDAWTREKRSKAKRAA